MTIRFKTVCVNVAFSTKLVVVVPGLNVLTTVLMEGSLVVTDLADIGGRRRRISTGIIAQYAGLVVKCGVKPVIDNISGTDWRFNGFAHQLDVGCIFGMAPVTVFI